MTPPATHDAQTHDAPAQTHDPHAGEQDAREAERVGGARIEANSLFACTDEQHTRQDLRGAVCKGRNWRRNQKRREKRRISNKQDKLLANMTMFGLGEMHTPK